MTAIIGIKTSIINTTEGSATSDKVALVALSTTTSPAPAIKPTAIGMIIPITIRATAIRITLLMSEAKLNQLLENKNMKKIQIFLYNNKICSLLRLFIKSLFKIRVESFLEKILKFC